MHVHAFVIARFVGLMSLSVAVGPRAAWSLDWKVEFEHRILGEQVPSELLFLQPRTLRTSTAAESLAAYQGSLFVRFEGRPIDPLGLVFALDTGLLEVGPLGVFASGQSILVSLSETAWLGETYAEWQFGDTGAWAIRAGKVISNVGQSLVYYGYAFSFGTDVDFALTDWSVPWTIEAEALFTNTTFTRAGKDAPLFQLASTWEPVTDVLVSIFGAAQMDGKNSFSTVLSDAVFRGRMNEWVERQSRIAPARTLRSVATAGENLRQAYRSGLIGFDVTTRGILGFFGLGLHVDKRAWRIRADGVMSAGSLETKTTPLVGTTMLVERLRPIRGVDGAALDALVRTSADEVSLLSGAFALSAEIDVVREVSLEGFIVFATGEGGYGRSDRPATYTGFLAPGPRLSYTTLFFRGGLGATLTSPAASSLAPDGAGLFSAGANATFTIMDVLVVRPTIAWMTATIDDVGAGGLDYGTELDLSVEWRAIDFCSLRLEGAAFWPGPFFGDAPFGGQITLAAAFSFGS